MPRPLRLIAKARREKTRRAFFVGMKIAFVRIMNKIPAKTALACGVFATGVNLIHMRSVVLIGFQHFNKR